MTSSPTTPQPNRRRLLGIAVSVAVFLGIWLMPAPAGLSLVGQRTLAVTLFAVVWWIFGVTAPAYTTLLMFTGYIVLGLAKAETVFRLWTTPLMWLMVGAFLIAAAVTKSGLARRVALLLMLRFASSYRSLVVLVYVLGFLLSFLIPQPFPRTLLIMAVVGAVIDSAGMDPRDAASLGFATFAGATATSMMLLTGDAMLNAASVGFSGTTLTWLGWAQHMGVPGLLASLLMLSLHLLLFRPVGTATVDTQALRMQLQAQGPLSRTELRTLAWVLVALALWATDFIHHVDPAWVALGVSVALSLPMVGDVLAPSDVTDGINWPILIFVTGALAIGTVGRETGVAQWIATVFLPATPPSNPYLFALLIGGATMAVHMFLGSALAVMSIVAPPMVAWATQAGWSGLVPALLAYTAVEIHYLLPFQHVTILLGEGKAGRYGSRETLRYGIPLTFVTLGVMLFEILWWQQTGLIGK